MTTTETTAGTVRSTGFEWVYECSLCDHRGHAHYSDGAFANLGNHLMREHIVVQKHGTEGAGVTVLARCPSCGGFDGPVNNIAPAATLSADPCTDPFHA